MPTCFLCLQIKNPKWKPTDQGAQFISTIKENGECETFKYCSMFSLRRRRNQTPVSNVCKVAPISLFWAANGLNNLPEMRFRFPFNLIGKSTMAFLTVQLWRVLKSWYTGGGPEQGFRR